MPLLQELKKIHNYKFSLTKQRTLINCSVVSICRCGYKENVDEELFCCRSMKDHTTEKDIYLIVDDFLKTHGSE